MLYINRKQSGTRDATSRQPTRDAESIFRIEKSYDI